MKNHIKSIGKEHHHQSIMDCQEKKVSPLPSFTWASGAEVWNCMLEKDAMYSKLRSDKMLQRHPSLVDSYRTILYDWLSEVAHECKFHRETYHLAIDFTDRYLSAQANVGKLQLQLIGVTCLFLASKFEEIRPPTVIEFAELTDGACKAEDIINYEVVILSAINWEITPMTPNNWLNMYMQILLNLDNDDDENQEEERDQVDKSHNVTKDKQGDIKNDDSKQTSSTKTTTTTTTSTHDLPNRINGIENKNNNNNNVNNYDCKSRQNNVTNNILLSTSTTNGIFKANHKRIASVIDLALLHTGTLKFSNSVVTASALYHFTDDETIYLCTGFRYLELAECVEWLRPFVETIKDIREPVFLASCRADVDSIQIHTHIATAKLLDKVILKIEEQTISQTMKRKACCMLEDDLITDSDCESVVTNYSPNKPTTLLTPPRSARKSRRV